MDEILPPVGRKAFVNLADMSKGFTNHTLVHSLPAD